MSHKDNPKWQEYFGDCDPVLLNDFRKYHQENKELYGLFLKYAREAKASGRERFSVWMIANRARWYSQVETSGKDYKVSNDYLALYARLIMYQYPEYEGFFLIKRMKKKRVKARE